MIEIDVKYIKIDPKNENIEVLMCSDNIFEFYILDNDNKFLFSHINDEFFFNGKKTNNQLIMAEIYKYKEYISNLIKIKKEFEKNQENNYDKFYGE